jgi:hypothetical protein
MDEGPFSVVTYTQPGSVPWRLVVRQPDETGTSIAQLMRKLPDWLKERNTTKPVLIDMNTGRVIQE